MNGLDYMSDEQMLTAVAHHFAENWVVLSMAVLVPWMDGL